MEQKAFRGKLWATFGMEQLTRKIWERFTIKKTCTRSVLADADRVWRNGRDGRSQLEAPLREELELVSHSNDLRFEGVLMLARAWVEF